MSPGEARARETAKEWEMSWVVSSDVGPYPWSFQRWDVRMRVFRWLPGLYHTVARYWDTDGATA